MIKNFTLKINGENIADIHYKNEVKPQNARISINESWEGLTAKQARKMSAWLLKAAEKIEQHAKKEPPCST